MKPKSRLYELVREWSKKPIHQVKDVSTTIQGYGKELGENFDLKRWWERQELKFEAILNPIDNTLHGVIQNDLKDCAKEDVIRLFNEGVLSASYWHSSNKPIPIVLPLKSEYLLDQSILKGIKNSLFNCHLPIGLVQVAISSRPSENELYLLQDSLIQLQRLGILFHLYFFDTGFIDQKLLEIQKFEYIHLDKKIILNAYKDIQEAEKLRQLIKLIKSQKCRVLAGPLSLIKESIFVKTHDIDACFGPIVMPAMTRAQILKLNHSGNQQAAIKNHLKNI